MRKKFVMILIVLLITVMVLDLKIFAKSYSSTYFNITIPDSYSKASTSNDSNQYSEDYTNLKWNGGYVNIDIYVLKQPAENPFTTSDINNDANNIQKTLGSSVACSILHKDLVNINGHKGKRLTYSGTFDKTTFYEDEYTLLSQKYIYCINFTTDKKEFIDSTEQKSIISSFKILDSVFLPFKDVKSSSWYYNAVLYTYSNGIIAGYNDTTFAPNDKLTRAMLVTIIYRMEGSQNNDGKSKFSDVPSNEWYSKAIKWASNCNIIHGYDRTTRFGPNDNITREDVVVILKNYASFKKKNVNQTASLSKFSDYNKVDNYANSAMQWAVKTGVITGNDNGTLDPRGNATRAEAAAMIQKYCNKVGR